MVQMDWGIKRLCQNCGALFYDFDRDPIVCPKCSSEFDPDAILKSRRGRGVVEEKVVEQPPKAAAAPSEAEAEVADDEDGDDLDLPDVEEEEDEEIDEELVAEDTDNDLMEDTSDLGEDDADMAEVMEHREEKEDR